MTFDKASLPQKMEIVVLEHALSEAVSEEISSQSAVLTGTDCIPSSNVWLNKFPRDYRDERIGVGLYSERGFYVPF